LLARQRALPAKNKTPLPDGAYIAPSGLREKRERHRSLFDQTANTPAHYVGGSTQPRGHQPTIFR